MEKEDREILDAPAARIAAHPHFLVALGALLLIFASYAFLMEGGGYDRRFGAPPGAPSAPLRGN